MAFVCDEDGRIERKFVLLPCFVMEFLLLSYLLL